MSRRREYESVIMRLFGNRSQANANDRYWRQFPSQYTRQTPESDQYSYWYTFPKGLSALVSKSVIGGKNKRSKKQNGYEDSSLFTVRAKPSGLTRLQMVGR